MCGIVGIVGKNQAEQIIMTGLERLEYRGYDSPSIPIPAPRRNLNFLPCQRSNSRFLCERQ